MKQLTQAVFDLPQCPPDVESAAVDAYGDILFCSGDKRCLKPAQMSFNSTNCDYILTAKGLGKGYNTTDWQNSAINRESKSSKNGEQ